MRGLWLGAVGLSLFILTGATWMVCVSPGPAECRRNLGFDFLAFYTAGTFVREGRAGDLYNIEKVRAFEHDLARRESIALGDGAVGPWWNPPLYAWVFEPLSRLSFRSAVVVWIAINLCAIAIAVTLLCSIMRKERDWTWRTWAIVPLLVLVSAPLLQTVTHGQNSGTSLLLLTLAVLAWRSKRAMTAGLLIGLLSYKPQLAGILGLVLILNLGWRAAIGLALSGGAMLVLNLVTLPGTIDAYLHQLPGNLRYMQVDNPYNWERHVTLKGFWRLLIQGAAAGETSMWVGVLTVLFAIPLITGFAKLLWTSRTAPRLSFSPVLGGEGWDEGLIAQESQHKQSTDSRDRPLTPTLSPEYRGEGVRDTIITIAIVLTPLLMPFYFDYDLLLLVVPLVLCIANRATGPTRIDRIAWASLFVWLYLNPFLAAALRVNVTVIILSFIAGRLVLAANRAQSASASPAVHDSVDPSRRIAA